MSREELIEALAKEARGSERFSKTLWEEGDKPNAHFQSGRQAGIGQAIYLIKQYEKEAQR